MMTGWPQPHPEERLRHSRVFFGWISGAAQYGSLRRHDDFVGDYNHPLDPGPTLRVGS